VFVSAQEDGSCLFGIVEFLRATKENILRKNLCHTP
jgi:hypothetical protein